jgi:hypothetical protein
MTNETESENYSTLLGRLQKLERDNHRMKRVGTVALVAISALIFMGQAGKNRALEADSLTIRDDKGNARMELGTTAEHMPFVRMFGGSHDFPSLVLLAEPSGSSLLFMNGTGSMELSTVDHPLLFLTDSTGSTSIRVASVHTQDSDKFSAILGRADTLNPKTGASTQTSAASLTLFGKDGKVIWQAP